MAKNEPVFTKDFANKKLTVVRAFDASLKQVWQAWTLSEILNQWWAPKPYRLETKKMDFREGGIWLYCMIGPEGNKIWCRVDYSSIELHKYITCLSRFCDEEGTINMGFPNMYWKELFSPKNKGTTATIEITFDKVEDMETIVNVGFKDGFTSGLGNLDQYLDSHRNPISQ
jgi:uncharacterized protein YndB with AHSA1/START domain